MRNWVLESLLGEQGAGPTPAEGAAARDTEDTPTPEREPPPAGFVDVAASEELVDDGILEVMAGPTPVALVRIDGRAHAVSGVCPHAGGPLADGLLDGTELTCPWHGWAFDVVTGSCAVDPDAPLQRYPIREEGGRILVRPPE